LRPETLRMVVHDLLDSLTRHGFRRVVLSATHGGNEAPLKEAAAASEWCDSARPSLRVAVGALPASPEAGACHPAKPADMRASCLDPWTCRATRRALTL
jgi:creatinine amidohydrolase/Fe(II)-dependent formamide hydrolase-like protein